MAGVTWLCSSPYTFLGNGTVTLVISVLPYCAFLSWCLKDEDGAGGPEPERPPEAGGGSSSMATGEDDVMDTVS